MLSEELKKELVATWSDYGEAIRIAFRFKAGWGVEGSTVASLLSGEDENAVRDYIAYMKREADELKSMKHVGER